MRIAYLIKESPKSAELVAHGAKSDVKKQFLDMPIKQDETLHLFGHDIRPKRRGGRQDINQYLATVEKENAAMREAARKNAATAQQKTVVAVTPKKADEGKTPEVIRIKKEASTKHATTHEK